MIKILLGLSVGLALIIFLAVAAWNHPKFVMFRCHESERSVTVNFREIDKTRPITHVSKRHITFMGHYREFAIIGHRRGEKAAYSWDKVSAVELRRAESRSQGGHFAIQLNPEHLWFGEPGIDFGYMDEACWQKLKRRYSADLTFVETLE